MGGSAGEPASYWQATAGPGAPFAALPGESEVVVVGGGLLGSAAAYWLARGGARVTLIEREMLAYGATGRNGGFMGVGMAEGYPAAIARVGHEAARAVWQLTLDNRALLREVLAGEGIDCDYREPGRLNLALGEAEHAEQARTVAALRADGFAAELLDRRQAQELVGTPLGPEVVGADFAPEIGLLHSARLAQGLAGAAARHGARLCRAAVTGLAPAGGGVTVRTSAGDVRAGAVIVAANAWTDTLSPALAGRVTPVRGQMLAYAPTARVFTTALSAAATPTGEYWQQTLDGSIVLGGCRAVAPDRDVGVREGVPTAEVQAALEGLFPRLFPQLTLRVARRWAGLMAFTPDYLPVADRAPGLPGVWVVGGFCGHGMPFGLVLGKHLAAAATSGVAPAALAPLRIARPTLVGEVAAGN